MNMGYLTRYLFTIFIILSTTTIGANAKTKTEIMSDCLVSKTTGSDRILLVRWIGYSIAGHYAIRGSMGIPDQSIEQSDKDIAALITQLLLQRCLDETQDVVSEGGAGAVGNAFRILGEVAMQEVMMDKAVNARIEKFSDYLNRSDFERLLK